MAYKSDFHTAVATVRPLMKDTRNMGDFTDGLIDMGLRPDPNSEGKVLALALRANATWKCYANETSQPPSDSASELVGRWDQYRFADNVTNAYEEPAQNGLTDNLNALDASTTKGNVAEGLGSLLFRVSTQATYSNATATPATLTLVDKADRDGAAYIDEKTNRLRLGDRPMAQPPQTTTLDTIQNQELVYVAALLSVYCEEQERSETKSTVDDIPKRLTSHLQNQRKAFHQAEWVREVSWNYIYNGQPLFDEFLQAMYAEVTDTNLRQHSNGLEQLLATLSQSAAVQLDDVRLEQIIDPIDAWSRKGRCHELVARNRMGWDRLIEATFLDISFEAELRAPVLLFLLGDAADGDHLGTLETITVNARTFGVGAGADNLNGRHRHASRELNTSTVLIKEVLLHPALQGRVKMEGITAPARFAITSAGESAVNQMHSSYAQCFFSSTLETIGQTSDSGTNKSAAIIKVSLTRKERLMTSSFWITNITVARHPSRQDSSVHFESGVNAICGPSNSGESCSLQCINYMFAMDHTQFVINKESGNTQVRMGVSTLRGALTLVRPIGKGDNTEITSPNPHIYSGIYMRDKPRRPPTLNSAWLRLIGYEHTEELRIISNKDLAVNAFTWRAFWHALYANEDRINAKGPVLLPPQKTAESAFKCALASLITGKDCAAYTRHESTENKKFRNNAIIDYLVLPPEQLDQRIELIDRVSGTGAPAEIEQQVEEPSTELGHAQQGITEAAQRGQEIVSRLHEVRGNLAESGSLRGRYEELASSYRALIDRFDFVHEGHILTGDLMSPTPCLACTQNLPSEAQASVPVTIPRERKELPIVRLEGLGQTMSQTDREQGLMQGQKHELVSEAETSAFHIRGELKPQLQALTISIAGHSTIIAMQTERQQHLEHKKVTEEELKELINHEFTVTSFNLLDECPKDFWSHMSTNLVDILYACAFLELKDPRFSHEFFDTVVNGKTKTKEGQAYRPFVNTAVLLALRNYLSSEAAVQNSGVLIINTPPLGLDNPQTGPDLQEARDTILAALYDYFAGAQDMEQMIIADNTKFMPDIRPLHER